MFHMATRSVHNVNQRPAYRGTQAVQRAVLLLKALGREAGEPTLAELVRLLGLNKTTAYRLLSALEAEGLVERGASDGYRLGPELVALGGRALGANDLREAARPALLALARETREAAHLELRVGADTLILDEALSAHRVGTSPSVGTRWPAHATSTGKVLLAALEPADLRSLLAFPLEALTPRTITDEAALQRELARVRDRGYATGVEELEPGFVAVAVPIQARDGHVVAALGIGGPRVRLDTDRLDEVAALLQAQARLVAGRLGAKPLSPAKARAGTRPAQPRRKERR
jgi:DNA-binding IclR family transcriptional regulator